MNWLIYISGGFLFVFGIGGYIQSLGENKDKIWYIFFALLSVWIWICWRFIG